ncbi:MAG: helix-turn-helix domain-containing protein [Oricola sp.]
MKLRSVVVEDAAQQAALQSWVPMECYQLTKGDRVAQLDMLDLGPQPLVRERQETGVQKLGATPADFCTISICTHKPATRFSEHSGGRVDTVFFLPGNAEFDIHIPAGGETAYAGFSQKEFLRGARALDPAFWERPPQGGVPLATNRGGEFKDAVDLWLKTAQDAARRGEDLDPAIMRGHLLQTVLHIATTQVDGATLSFNDRSRALQIGRTARAFVDDRLETDELPTVFDICEALDVSERTLQYAFREYVGLSPTAYLRTCRLNRVRAELTASGPQEATITQMAMRFGFLHLGRFAGDYKRMFGESPSATLAS